MVVALPVNVELRKKFWNNKLIGAGSQGESPVPRTHPKTGALLEEGELICDLTDDQLKALSEDMDVDVSMSEDMSMASEESDLEDIVEIEFVANDADTVKYIREYGKIFYTFNKSILNKSESDIQERMANPENSTQSNFVS
ncbi:hypothetical protein Hanom_Chr12g01170681 [Helianthus anomalus]